MADITLNRAGIKSLLTDPLTAAAVRNVAERIAYAAGPGMETRPMETRTRVRVAVVTATNEAVAAEARYRALTRAVRG